MFQHGFVMGEAKKCSSKKMQGPMAKKYCYNKIIMNFFWGKEYENKRMVELDIFFFFFKTAHFGHTL